MLLLLGSFFRVYRILDRTQQLDIEVLSPQLHVWALHAETFNEVILRTRQHVEWNDMEMPKHPRQLHPLEECGTNVPLAVRRLEAQKSFA